MSVSFEINDVCEVPAVAWVVIPVMVERPKSARQARWSLLIKMFAFKDGYNVSVETFKKNNLYPFQISMNHVETMHVCQAICNINQLNRTLVRLCGVGIKG